MNLAPTCRHFERSPNGVTFTVTAGPFVCPWCEIERLEHELHTKEGQLQQMLNWQRDVFVRQHDAAAHIERLRRSLEVAGFTDAGGELWKPPLGRRYDIERIDRLRVALERATATFADLVKGLGLLNRPLIAETCELAEKECRAALAESPMAAADLVVEPGVQL